MGPERVVLALAILAGFAAVFAAAGRFAPDGRRSDYLLTQAGGVLLPFSFAIYFAADTRLDVGIVALAALLVPVSAAAAWLAQQQQRAWIATGAAAAGVAVVATWLMRAVDSRGAWEIAGVAVALAAAVHVFAERRSDDARHAAPAALVAAFGHGLFLVLAPRSEAGVALWPWLAGWIALAGLLVRHAIRFENGALVPAAAAGVAIGVGRFVALRADAIGTAVEIEAAIAASLGIAIAWQLVALTRARSSLRAFFESAAGASALIATLALANPVVARGLDAWVPLAASLAFGVLAALVATRLANGVWLLAALVATALVHVVWSFAELTAANALLALALHAGAALLFTAWPLAAGRSLLAQRFALYASALAAPAFFLPMLRAFDERFGDAAIGAVPVALGALALGAAHLHRRSFAGDADGVSRLRGAVWYLAVAIGFAAAAVPLQLDREWITVAWALEGFGLVWLWTRLDHPGLKWVATALLVAVTVRLVANPELLAYHPRSGWPVLNWLLYTYLVPAAALLASAQWLSDREVARARPFERPLYARGWPIASISAGVGGLLVIFAWLNLAILDAFAEGSALALPSDHRPARDLSQSIAWAVYGLVLLAIGVRRGRRALRWASLALVMATVAKVFLHDLGELRDLYRVASLLGLALSLIIVSLAYQRFVLRRDASESE